MDQEKIMDHGLQEWICENGWKFLCGMLFMQKSSHRKIKPEERCKKWMWRCNNITIWELFLVQYNTIGTFMGGCNR